MKADAIVVLVVALATLGGTGMVEAQMGGSNNDNPGCVLSYECPVSESKNLAGLSSDTHIVSILFGGLQFNIPRNFLESVVLDKYPAQGIHPERVDVTFVVDILYPEFIGATRDGSNGRALSANDRHLSWKDHPNLIRLVSTNNMFDPLRDLNKLVLSDSNYEKDPEWMYGLHKSIKRSLTDMDVYYRRKSEDEDGYVVTCLSGSFERCDVRYRISNNVVIQYEYNPAMMPYWKEIDNKVKSLLSSFIR